MSEGVRVLTSCAICAKVCTGNTGTTVAAWGEHGDTGPAAWACSRACLVALLRRKAAALEGPAVCEVCRYGSGDHHPLCVRAS